jgi:hypothetical protein
MKRTKKYKNDPAHAEVVNHYTLEEGTVLLAPDVREYFQCKPFAFIVSSSPTRQQRGRFRTQ